MTFNLTMKEARRLGLLPVADEPKPARKSKRVTSWARSNIDDWEGPDGWRVGISRGLYDSGMVDMVMAWRDGRPAMYEIADWEVFKAWNVEQTIAKLKDLEKP